MYPGTTRMVADPASMLVACESADGTALGHLYVRGMCEELGLAPTILSHRGGSIVRVPVWDGLVPKDSDVLDAVLPEIVRRYALKHGLPNPTPIDSLDKLTQL